MRAEDKKIVSEDRPERFQTRKILVTIADDHEPLFSTGHVRQQFAQTPTRYYEFLEVLEEFKSRKIGINGVIDRVSKFFRDHPNLIDGFTTFLPPGFEVRVNITATGNYIQINQPNGVTHCETVWKQPDPSKAAVMSRDELQELAEQEYEEQLNSWKKRRIIYEEQLNTYEKKVTAYENSQKEKARDVLVENPLAETQKQQEIFKNVWTDTERAVFTEKIALYGKKKDFAAIAAFLPTKTVQECIHFYYMTKKQNNYKQTFRQRNKKTGTQGSRPPIMPRFGDTNENIQSSGGTPKLTTGPAAKSQKQQMGGITTTTSTIPSQGKPAAKMTSAIPAAAAPPQLESQSQPQKQQEQTCEICDTQLADKDQYRIHLQQTHKKLLGKTASDMVQGAPLACSRCRERFWTYEGLERHLVMSHGLVTSDLLAKAQRKQDSGRCKLCGKSYDFSILQHLVTVHQVKLCSAQITYSCNSKIAKRPYPQQQEQSSSSSNKLPNSSTICQPPAEKKKKKIDEEAIGILAKDSFLKMFFEKHNYEYIHEDFVQALYQFSIKQRKQIEQASAGSEHRNNE